MLMPGARRRRRLPRDRHGYDPRRQCRLVQREVPGLSRSKATERLRRQIKGQMDGIGSRPRLRASGAERRSAGRSGLSDRGGAGRSGRDGRCRRLAAGRASRHADRGRSPRRAWRAGLCAAGTDRPRRRVPPRALRRPWRRCISRTIWRRSARCWRISRRLPQVACFDTAFHRTHDARRRSLRDSASASCRGCAALRLSRPVLRIHRPRPCRAWRPRSRSGG